MPIESRVPFDQSLLWDVHHAYFAERGVEAWKQGEIPYFSTSNAAYASQHARLFMAHVADLEAAGRLLPGAPLVVLECAGGAGVFASNFLFALDDLAPALSARLTYVFSDYLESSVFGAATTAPLAPWVQSGKVVLARLDVTRPSELVLLAGATLPAKPLMVIANYLCCVLPMKHLSLWGDAGWHELVVTIAGIDGDAAHDRETFLATIAKSASEWKLLERIDVLWEWEPVALEAVVPDATERRALVRAVGGMVDATVGWPLRYLAFLAGVHAADGLLADGGLVLTCDFGTNDAWRLQGRRTGIPHLYGNTLNQAVNTHRSASFAAEAGLACLRTTSDLGSVHAVVTSAAPLGALTSAAFTQHFMQVGSGDDALDYWTAGVVFRNDKQPLRALRFFLRCAELDRRNPEHRYIAAEIALELGQADRAIAQLMVGHALDGEGRFDFDFQLGRAYAMRGDHASAIQWYQRSLAREPHPVAWTNLGVLHAHEGQLSEAYHAFKQALALDPRHALAEQRLQGLKDLVWLRAVRDFDTQAR